jgi:hypothetical protein
MARNRPLSRWEIEEESDVCPAFPRKVVATGFYEFHLRSRAQPIKGAEPKEVGRGKISSKRESAEDEGIRSSFSSKRQQDWLRQT